MKTVFVTVGTTRFDQLIQDITSPENVQVRKCVVNKLTGCCLLVQMINVILSRSYMIK